MSWMSLLQNIVQPNKIMNNSCWGENLHNCKSWAKHIFLVSLYFFYCLNSITVMSSKKCALSIWGKQNPLSWHLKIYRWKQKETCKAFEESSSEEIPTENITQHNADGPLSSTRPTACIEFTQIHLYICQSIIMFPTSTPNSTTQYAVTDREPIWLDAFSNNKRTKRAKKQ